jgi:Transposase DDE domain group 1
VYAAAEGSRTTSSPAPKGPGCTRSRRAAITIAVDLICWLRLYALNGTGLAKAEPKTLRYRLLTVPTRLTRARRYRSLRLPRTWPWATDLATAFDRIRRLPPPAT